jgi:predicted O-methyltransferase YrrM
MMPLARTYDPAAGRVVTTLRDAYLDRLATPGDIREYLPYLYGQVAGRPGCRVLELGTRKGNSTLAFLAAAQECGGHVTSCDIADVLRMPGGMGRWAGCPWWTFIRGDDLHPAVRAALPSEVDVLFVDTTHYYAETRAELAAFMPRVRGVALFHDTKVFPHPDEYAWDGEAPPVRQALDDWCAETGTTWEEIPGEYGLGVIRAG